MAKRKGLPSKYAKMGFKRGWKAYKASKRTSTKTSSYTKKRKITRNKKRGGNKNMGFGNILGAGLGKSVIAGAAVGIINKFIPINLAGADYLIAGMVMKEPLLSKLGGITLGRSVAGSLAGGLGGIFAGGNGNGGNGVVR